MNTYKLCEDFLKKTKVDIEKAERGKKYCAVRSLAEKYLESCPDCNEMTEILKKAEDNIANSDIVINKKSGKPDNIVDYCRAYDVCSDNPRINSYLRANPPCRPKDIYAKPSVNSICIYVIPNNSNLGPIDYKFMRLEDKVSFDPSNVSETFRTRHEEYRDKEICLGVKYRYYVFAVRCGVESKEWIGSEPVACYPEVGDLAVIPLHNSVSLSFCVPVGFKKIKVMRHTKEGEKRNLDVEQRTGIVMLEDNDVDEDTDYTYGVVIEYQDGTETAGVEKTCRIEKLPQPAKIISLSQGKKGIVEVQVDKPCHLYSSETEPNCRSNAIALSELKKTAKIVASIPNSQDKHTINLSNRFRGVVYPVICAGDVAVVGTAKPVCLVEAISRGDLTVSNGDYVLTFEPQDGAFEYVILTRTDAFPTSFEDPKAKRMHCNPSAFVRMGKKYIIGKSDSDSLFASVFVDYGDGHISEGEQLKYLGNKKMIKYSVSKAKFGGRCLVITFESKYKGEVPKMIVVDGGRKRVATATGGKWIGTIGPVHLDIQSRVKLSSIDEEINPDNVVLFFEDSANSEGFYLYQ